MYSNTGFTGNSYKWFMGQVPIKKNQYQANAKYENAWGDRVKVRIPGIHPQDATLKDDDLPWAIVAKPTSQGNFNGGSTGIMGGEWVIGFFLDSDSPVPQIPIITHVLGVNLVGQSSNAKRLEQLGSTLFQPVDGWDATDIKPGNTAIIGGPPPSKSAGKDLTKDEFKNASTKPSSPTTSTGIPPEPKITTNPNGTTSITTYKYDSGVEGGRDGFTRVVDGQPSQSLLNAAKAEQAMFYQNEVSRLSGGANAGFSR